VSVLSDIPLGVTLFFLGIVCGLAVLLIVATARAGRNLGETPYVTRRWVMGTAGFIIVWLAATAILAVRGKLSDWSQFPPPVMKLIMTAVILTFCYAFSRLGGRLVNGLNWASLIGFQAFRVPVEISLYLLYRYGIIPIQMTFEGRNWDILTGVSAIVAAWLASRNRLPQWGLWLWNLVGLGLLLNIVIVAVLSMPIPYRVFLNDLANTFITQAPYVWLPVFLVQAALFGHLLVFRKLWRAA
jgi:hypothetical protein